MRRKNYQIPKLCSRWKILPALDMLALLKPLAKMNEKDSVRPDLR
jgi:hypothetical protein